MNRTDGRHRSNKNNLKHGGMSGNVASPEYACWKAIKIRCFSASSAPYRNYGGRGITMCERWRHSFAEFLKDVGYRPSPLHSIDRINNDGHYEPGNVRWVTGNAQQNNRRPYSKWLTRQRAEDGTFARSS